MLYCIALWQQNSLQDSLQAFHEVSHNHFLEKTDFILFLNKKDIFMDRIATTTLAACFPGYRGQLIYTGHTHGHYFPSNRRLLAYKYHSHRSCLITFRSLLMYDTHGATEVI